MLTVMLNSFFKRLLKNEGIVEEQDDIFRQVYIENRKKISMALKSRPEVELALR